VRYQHFTLWDLAGHEFPIAAKTPDDASFYWRHRFSDQFRKPLAPDHAEFFASNFGPTVGPGLVAAIEARAVEAERAKELAFEAVRSAHYPTLPSRQQSIFLVPEGVGAPREYMIGMGYSPSELSNRTLVEIELPEHAVVHEGHLAHLNCNSRPHLWEGRAHHYWSGRPAHPGELGEGLREVLYVGEFRVLRAGE
tara:strand:+ start:930 stop:1514 length:585 start_codon:yes stop_codon:yes gene_type:complete